MGFSFAAGRIAPATRYQCYPQLRTGLLDCTYAAARPALAHCAGPQKPPREHTMTIEAVLWDFGGVILSSPFEAFNRYEAEMGLPHDFIRRVNAVNPDHNAWAQMERSEIGLERFAELFEAEARALGGELSGHTVLGLLSGEVRPEMVQALERVRERFRIACITNNMPAGHGPSMTRSPETAAKVTQIMQLFEHVVESSKLNMRKPDPRIYRHACELLGVAPEACVYLDDLGINLKPARAMGMATIKVNSAAQALAELEALLGISLR
jgi:putative hydrolase of the HAD superfamily